MFDFFPNRRSQRSNNKHDALTFQLKATAKRAGFSSLVLGDDEGLVVVGTGNKSLNEYLASVAPGLTSGEKAWHGSLPTDKGRVLMHVAPIKVEDKCLYLSATEGLSGSIVKELFNGGRGIARILAN